MAASPIYGFPNIIEGGISSPHRPQLTFQSVNTILSEQCFTADSGGMTMVEGLYTEL